MIGFVIYRKMKIGDVVSGQERTVCVVSEVVVPEQNLV